MQGTQASAASHERTGCSTSDTALSSPEDYVVIEDGPDGRGARVEDGAGRGAHMCAPPSPSGPARRVFRVNPHPIDYPDDSKVSEQATLVHGTTQRELGLLFLSFKL